MDLNLEDWHLRFTQQAQWTEQIRAYLYQHCALTNTQRVLEVGCGTGIITTDIKNRYPVQIFGVDKNFASLQFATKISRSDGWLAADGEGLPFVSGSFDVTVCHFLLLWVKNPFQALNEMRRVTQSGGYVIAMAEPDYGGRIDYPPELVQIGLMQTNALIQQGADPTIGRKLNQLFHAVGLESIQVGCLGGHWDSPPSKLAWESEWTILASDIGDQLDQTLLAYLRTADADAWKNGSRTLFVPTFFAIGQVP